MATPGIPQNFVVQTANRTNLVSWALSVGATSYLVQRSLDNVTYIPLATVSGSPLATSYLDSAVTSGTTYWYQVAASNGTNTSAYTTSQSVVPTQTGEMSLGAIRLAAMQRADRVNSNFVTTEEWGNYINQSQYELYDLLTTVYEDYNIATPISFTSDGITFNYPLPDGVLTYTNGLTNQPGFVAPSFYKLMGVDLALNNVNNAYVTINKYNFIDRNRYVYPNTSSTLYGVFNCQYRLFGNNIQFIPTPTSGQVFRIWYIPRLTELIQDKDVTTIGISGWIEYVIVKAAYYALTKEESDTSALVMQLQALNDRIQSSASNRDAGQPDTISDTRNGSSYPWGSGSGFNGSSGGW